MPRKYRTFTDEFKREAVQLAEARKQPVTQIARQLGVRVNQIYKWKKQLEEKQPNRQPPVKSGEAAKQPALIVNNAQSEEINRLRKQVERLEAEKEILKKAAAYFAKDLV